MKRLIMLAIIGLALTSPSGSMAKCTSGNCQNGNGVFSFKDGAVYVGQFKNGQLHGQGKLGFAEGGYYEGAFDHGKFQGKGVLLYANGKKITGDFADNKFIPPTQSIKFWEMSDAEIYSMLNQAATEPNQTRFLDQERINKIRSGWQAEQITDKKQAIATAFDYLLRVNNHFNMQAVQPRSPAPVHADQGLSSHFANLRRQEAQQKERDAAEGEQRLAAMKRRPTREISNKCQGKYPDNYLLQKWCIENQTESKAWIESNR